MAIAKKPTIKAHFKHSKAAAADKFVQAAPTQTNGDTPARNLVPFTFRMDDKQFARARAAAAHEGINITSYIVLAIMERTRKIESEI